MTNKLCQLYIIETGKQWNDQKLKCMDWKFFKLLYLFKGNSYFKFQNNITECISFSKHVALSFDKEVHSVCVWILYQQPIKSSRELTQQENFLSIIY